MTNNIDSDQVRPTTAGELLRSQPLHSCSELIQGKLLVREPAGFRHGEIAARMARLIGNHVYDNALGQVFAAETGFKLAADPDTVRAPDVAYISQNRIPDPPPVGYAEIAPDLVVEVVSPDDRPGAVLAKVADWISAGCQLVWVLDPQRFLARIYRADGSAHMASWDEDLGGETVLPGFVCSLSEILGPKDEP